MDAAGTVCGRGRHDRRASRSSRRRDRRGRLAACLTVRRCDIRAGPPRSRADVDAIRGRGPDRGRLAPGRAHLDARTSDASSAATTTCPSTDAPQTVYEQLAARLGGDLARALTTQQQLSSALDQTAASEQALTDQISQQESIISDLEDKVAQLDTLIQETQDRIDVERAQVTAMARAAYRQPKSLLEIVARAGSLRQALVSTFELVVAGDRAHAVQARLEADLLKQQADRKARLADLDRANGLHDQLLASMSELDR